MPTMMPDYQEGQTVLVRPQYAALHPKWEGATGVIENVWHKYLPAIQVYWLSGPKEGKSTKTPFYQIVPEGQEELLSMEVEDGDEHLDQE